MHAGGTGGLRSVGALITCCIPPPPRPLPHADAEDLAAAACRGEQPRGHIGLFPEFALFNHSCAPNAINFVVGRSMVVRAAEPIKAGDEVTISYLGRPQLTPVTRRMQALEEDYGFECDCRYPEVPHSARSGVGGAGLQGAQAGAARWPCCSALRRQDFRC